MIARICCASDKTHNAGWLCRVGVCPIQLFFSDTRLAMKQVFFHKKSDRGGGIQGTLITN